MAAAQSEKKKVEPQKKPKKTLHTKLASKKIHRKEKKLQLKRGKQERKKVGVRPAHKGKGPGHSSKMAPQQKKAPVATKGNGNTASLGRNTSSHALSQDKGVKLGRNICAFSCKDLLYEVNELMRKELTRRMFANKRRVSH